jgi:hypothetical protein
MADVDIPGETAEVVLHSRSVAALGKGEFKDWVVALAAGKYGDLPYVIRHF